MPGPSHERAYYGKRSTYDEGFQLGAKVEHESARTAAATLVLAVLGKDRSDGVIDLGALGRWQVGGGNAGAEEVKCAHAYLDAGDICDICGRQI